MKQKLTLDDVGSFTWDFGKFFFIETAKGNFVWSDPDYGGDNTIRPTNHTYQSWIGESWGRDKGSHFIRNYCGEDVKILDE